MIGRRRRGQKLDGRRGEVFAVRLTPPERERLEALQAQAGPRRLGPWLVWSALYRGVDESRVVPGPEVIPGQVERQSVLPELVSQSVIPARGAWVSARAENCHFAAGNTLPADVGERTILDLCAGSGSWSEPYRLAGYRVVRLTLPDSDVRTYEHPGPVWGVLAAPPCEQFSLARNGHPEIARDIEGGLEVVSACLRVVFQTRPRWWALENPVGLLSRWLGTPADVWDPCDFGDPWTKRTAIWGRYTIPRRGPYVAPLGGGPLCSVCDPERRSSSWCNNAAHRAITPPGFARAFFEANP